MALAAEHTLPTENLLAPDSIRRLAWSPPEPLDVESVTAALRSFGARPWQIALTAEPLSKALADA
jgi:ribonuclease D